MRLAPGEFRVGVVARVHDDAGAEVASDVVSSACGLDVSHQVRVFAYEAVIAEQTGGGAELDVGEHGLVPPFEELFVGEHPRG